MPHQMDRENFEFNKRSAAAAERANELREETNSLLANIEADLASTVPAIATALQDLAMVAKQFYNRGGV